MNNIYISSDLHFFHKAILKHTDRPWKTIEEMNEALIDNWNKIVGKGLIYILGDLAMISKQEDGTPVTKMYRRLMARLKGKKCLILGNHDGMSKELYDCFSEVHNGLLERRICGERVTMSHYPLLTWEGCARGSVALHGHSHGRLKYKDDYIRIDVGVDNWNYSPINYEVLKIDIDNYRKECYNQGIFKKNSGYEEMD